MKYTPELRYGQVTVITCGNYAYCYRNAGPCYGGIREIVVDCSDIDIGDDSQLSEWLDEYAGNLYGDYIRNKHL